MSGALHQWKQAGDAFAAALEAVVGKLPEGLIKDAYTPDSALFNDAAHSLWLRVKEEGGGVLECQQILERAMAEVRKGLKECESPLEKRLLPYLVCQDYGPLNSGFADVHVPKLEAFLPPARVVIVPQMAFMKFRADFGVVAFKKGVRFTLAVECDGSKYHDAEKDKLRDVYFQSWGIPTIRATGKEVYREPRQIAARVAEALLQMVDASGLL